MKKFHAAWMVLALAACTNPLETNPAQPSDAVASVTATAKPVSTLGLELLSSDCNGITLRVFGTNLPGKAAFARMVYYGDNGLVARGSAINGKEKKSWEWIVPVSLAALEDIEFDGSVTLSLYDVKWVLLDSHSQNVGGGVAC